MLRVTEIYQSIQGESSYVGLPCVFVRLTGCNLRCVWCDTEHAFEGGQKMSVEDIVEAVRSYQCNLVELTGGEPLLQEESQQLVAELCKNDFDVLIETGGSQPIKDLHENAVVIMDIKCPGSGESGTLHIPNLEYLKYSDEVKFVISDHFDYEWAKNALQTYDLPCPVLFSPTHGILDPQELVKWVLEDKLKVRVQLQLHKYIWGEDAQGV